MLFLPLRYRMINLVLVTVSDRKKKYRMRVYDQIITDDDSNVFFFLLLLKYAKRCG